MKLPQKLKLELLYKPAMPLLGIYPKENKLTPKRDICTPMIIETLFTITKIWKQIKFSSMNQFKHMQKRKEIKEWLKEGECKNQFRFVMYQLPTRKENLSCKHVLINFLKRCLQKMKIFSFGTTWMEAKEIMLK